MNGKKYLLTQAEVEKYLGTFNCDVCEVVKDEDFDCDNTLDDDYRCAGEREWLNAHEFNERVCKVRRKRVGGDVVAGYCKCGIELDRLHDYEPAHLPNYCPNCGVKVVE